MLEIFLGRKRASVNGTGNFTLPTGAKKFLKIHSFSKKIALNYANFLKKYVGAKFRKFKSFKSFGTYYILSYLVSFASQ